MKLSSFLFAFALESRMQFRTIWIFDLSYHVISLMDAVFVVTSYHFIFFDQFQDVCGMSLFKQFQFLVDIRNWSWRAGNICHMNHFNIKLWNRIAETVIMITILKLFLFFVCSMFDALVFKRETVSTVINCH